jgi:hypothetical protein
MGSTFHGRIACRAPWASAGGVALAALLGACGETNEEAPLTPSGRSPGCDPYSCSCGLAEVSSGGGDVPSTCVGTKSCNVDAECPPARGGRVRPVCEGNGDVVNNGFSGHCVLPCAASETCPNEMQCIFGRCVFVTFDPNAACSSDADCAPEPGYRCASETCDGERRCRSGSVPCQRDQPVCGCDGQTYPDACSVFPVAVAHEGACD